MLASPIEFPASFAFHTCALREDGIGLICVGRFTDKAASRLEAEIRKLLTQSRRLVIDLSGAVSVDGHALDILTSVFALSRAERCDLEWIGCNAQLRQRLRICELLYAFQGYGEYL